MIKSRKCRNNQSELSNIRKSKCDKKELNKLCAPYFHIKNEMLKEFRLTKYSLHHFKYLSW
ncbi:hypothetical protein G9F71_010580 [Clostridium sp. FP2]|uniref:hypothetical protein n=1 Tax=Clostridium sp. FP2 TaxID=2724481 RepID=UPI001CCD1703|nr:hypothetical protein [Clostridium sp. FP2]MBZ9623296.1 hypothetical protein [Clostridium sp. FP2]